LTQSAFILDAKADRFPSNDMWVAAVVLQHNLALHARDTHFDHLAPLVRVELAQGGLV